MCLIHQGCPCEACQKSQACSGGHHLCHVGKFTFASLQCMEIDEDEWFPDGTSSTTATWTWIQWITRDLTVLLHFFPGVDSNSLRMVLLLAVWYQIATQHDWIKHFHKSNVSLFHTVSQENVERLKNMESALQAADRALQNPGPWPMIRFGGGVGGGKWSACPHHPAPKMSRIGAARGDSLEVEVQKLQKALILGFANSAWKTSTLIRLWRNLWRIIEDYIKFLSKNIHHQNLEKTSTPQKLRNFRWMFCGSISMDSFQLDPGTLNLILVLLYDLLTL